MPKLDSIELHEKLMAAQIAEHRDQMEFYAQKLEEHKYLLEQLKGMREARHTRMNAMLDALTTHITESVSVMRENDGAMFDQLMLSANETIRDLTARLDELSGEDGKTPEVKALPNPEAADQQSGE